MHIKKKRAFRVKFLSLVPILLHKDSQGIPPLGRGLPSPLRRGLPSPLRRGACTYSLYIYHWPYHVTMASGNTSRAIFKSSLTQKREREREKKKKSNYTLTLFFSSSVTLFLLERNTVTEEEEMKKKKKREKRTSQNSIDIFIDSRLDSKDIISKKSIPLSTTHLC